MNDFFGFKSEEEAAKYIDHDIIDAKRTVVTRSICSRDKECWGRLQDSKLYMYSDGSQDEGIRVDFCEVIIGSKSDKKTFRWTRLCTKT